MRGTKDDNKQCKGSRGVICTINERRVVLLLVEAKVGTVGGCEERVQRQGVVIGLTHYSNTTHKRNK